MKRLVLAFAFVVTACATTATPDGGTPGAAFGHCSSVALQAAGETLLGRVTTALATGDYVDQLAALATQFGAAEVGCGVDLVIAEFTKRAARSDDTEVAVVLVHAHAWRLANP